MGEEARNRVFRFVDDHFAEFVDDLTEYCAVRTVSATGEGFKEGGRATRKMLEKWGVNAREMPVPNGPNLVVGEAGTTGPTLCLYNHYDVQPEEPLDEWKTDPFGPVVREGALYARGTSDTKGNVLSQALAQAAIRDAVGDLPVRLRFMVEGEEEMSSPHLGAFWKRHQSLFEADGATIEGSGHTADGVPTMQLGSKGILYVELTVRKAAVDQHSSVAVSVPNPAWRLIAALRTLRDEDGKILLPGFYDNAHRPTEEELDYLKRNRFDPLDFTKTYGAAEVMGGDTQFARLQHMVYGNTCNIDGFYTGYIGDGAKTINPAYATAKLDFRLLPGQPPKEVLASLEAHLKAGGFTDVEVKSHGTFEPATTPLSSRIGQALLKGYQATYDQDPHIFPWSLGSSSTYYYTSLGTPSAAGPGVGYAGSKAHAPNEHIRLEDARRGIKATAAMMLAFAEGG
ncbi:MAG: M20/M25/M40 family metallo-hydrolase [Thermoplasmata archaeon]